MELYRYDTVYRDEYGASGVTCRAYKVVRETEATYFIDEWGIKKRVPKNGFNLWAHTTKEKALEHIIRRLTTRIKWFKYWQSTCEEALEVAIEARRELNLATLKDK